MAITISKFTCARCLANGTVDNTGTYLKVSLTYTAGASVTYRVSYGKDPDSALTLVKSGTGASFDGSFVSSSAILEADYAYTVSLIIAGTGEGVRVQRGNIPKSFVLLDFNASGKGIGVGKISDKPNELAIGMDMFDRFDTRILNGLAYYEQGGTADPDTCLEEMFLTNIDAIGGMSFVKQFFYGGKTANTNRTQIAFPYAYNSNGAMVGHKRSNYRRHYNGSAGGWSAWIEEPVIIESGSTGIWTYRKFSDGTAECFGKIDVTGVAVEGTLGGWYRSETLYEATAYPYPVTFSEAPATEMMFQTRNGSGALLWPFSANANNAKLYVPQAYIIRPVTAASVNGNINIIAKGKA